MAIIRNVTTMLKNFYFRRETKIMATPSFSLQKGIGWNKNRLTFTAARHMSATIRPDTLVSNIFEMAKLKTFFKPT